VLVAKSVDFSSLVKLTVLLSLGFILFYVSLAYTLFPAFLKDVPFGSLFFFREVGILFAIIALMYSVTGVCFKCLFVLHQRYWNHRQKKVLGKF
jgi:hypothetical protein